MGNWVIIIHGTGAHHNGSVTDADQIAANLTDELTKAGQFVTSAKFVCGGENNLQSPSSRVPLKNGSGETPTNT